MAILKTPDAQALGVHGRQSRVHSTGLYIPDAERSSWLINMPAQDTIDVMAQLLLEARPMMEEKCCHWSWCIEHRGIVSDAPGKGWPEIKDGMHPGCAPYRRWLERLDRVI